MAPGERAAKTVAPREEGFSLSLYLAGEVSRQFRYQLVLEHELEMPLYREKNFSFRVKLVDERGQLCPNANPITLALSVFSPANPP
jgi:hypothetical protein